MIKNPLLAKSFTTYLKINYTYKINHYAKSQILSTSVPLKTIVVVLSNSDLESTLICKRILLIPRITLLPFLAEVSSDILSLSLDLNKKNELV